MATLINAKTPWWKRIKLYRTAAELTQQETADRVGVEHRRYWGWENGVNVPTREHQETLAQVLGVERDDIFGGPKHDFEGLKTRKQE